MTVVNVTGTPISQLPTGTIDGLQAVFPLSVDMPSSPDTIRATLAQTAQYLQIGGAIAQNGAQMTYMTGTSYRVEAGSAIVNNQMLVWSSPITRTGVTMVSGTIQYCYLYSNNGTPAMEESTTVPVWDSTFQYYKKTGDVSRRCIGWLHGNSSSQIRMFLNKVYGRISEIVYLDLADLIASPAVNGGTSTSSWASFSLNGTPNHATDYWCAAKIVLPNDGDEGILGISPIDLGTGIASANAPYTVRGNAGKATARMFFGRVWLNILTPNTNYYRLTQQAGSPTASIEVQGARIIR